MLVDRHERTQGRLWAGRGRRKLAVVQTFAEQRECFQQVARPLGRLGSTRHADHVAQLSVSARGSLHPSMSDAYRHDWDSRFSRQRKFAEKSSRAVTFSQKVTCSRENDEKVTKTWLHIRPTFVDLREIAEKVTTSDGFSANFLCPENRESPPCVVLVRPQHSERGYFGPSSSLR